MRVWVKIMDVLIKLDRKLSLGGICLPVQWHAWRLPSFRLTGCKVRSELRWKVGGWGRCSIHGEDLSGKNPSKRKAWKSLTAVTAILLYGHWASLKNKQISLTPNLGIGWVTGLQGDETIRTTLSLQRGKLKFVREWGNVFPALA